MSLKAQTYVDHFIETVSINRSNEQPITVDDAKSWARIDDDFDDVIVDSLIDAATRAFEEYTRTLLYSSTVTVKYSFDRSGRAEFRLPYGPVDSITSVQHDGTDITYTQKGDWILLKDHDGEDVDIVYVAKTYDAADQIDGQIKIGLYKWVATNYDDRENTIVENINEMPNGSKQLWASYRRMQL